MIFLVYVQNLTRIGPEIEINTDGGQTGKNGRPIFLASRPMDFITILP